MYMPTTQEKEYLLSEREKGVSYLYRADGSMLIGSAIGGGQFVIVMVSESGKRLGTYVYDLKELYLIN